MYASAAYAATVDAEPLNMVLMPPCSCSKSAYACMAAELNFAPAAAAPAASAPDTMPLTPPKARFTPESTCDWKSFMLGITVT